MPFRLKAGDDTSCLNLYQPRRPRLLGVPEELIEDEDARFHFAATATPTGQPWTLLKGTLPGDVIPVGRGKGFPVAAVEPRRSLLLAGEQDGTAWSWELFLEPLGAGRTRLQSRTLGRIPRTWSSGLFMAVLRPAAFLMTRRMLIGIRQRAESLADSSPVSRQAA